METDFDDIGEQTAVPWEALHGARIFLTGGTGFFGIWLIESLIRVNRRFNLNIQAMLLSRDKTTFLAKNPHLAGAPELIFLQGDVRDFDFPNSSFTHIIHAATTSSVRLNHEQPDLMQDVIVRGTSRVLELAARSGTVRKILFVSSGAVYGRQRPEISHIAEDDSGLQAPLERFSAYAAGKREAERLCGKFATKGLPVTIARGFAFVGPHLPLDTHFAIGNFIRDALCGGPIEVCGDGSPYRSYLYASDLAIWLWAILIKGSPGRAYNVGSERRVSILQVAQLVAKEVYPGAKVVVAQASSPSRPVEQYVPSTARARSELGLCETVSLESAIRRTAAWARVSTQTR